MDTEVSLHTNGSFKPKEGNEKIIQNVMVLKEFEAFDCSKF